MVREPDTPRTAAGDGLVVRGTPIHEYEPTFTGEDYAQIARLLDLLTASAARRTLQEGGAAGDAA